MRGLIHNLYAYAFRGQALIGLGLVVWFISSVPDALTRDDYIGGPLTVAVIAGVAAIASIWPFLTPHWVGRPARKGQLVPLLLTHSILPMLYVFVAMSAVVAAGLAEPLAQYLAVAISMTLIAASAVCWGLGTILCFWSRRQQRPVSIIIDNGPVAARVSSGPGVADAYDDRPSSQMKAS